ncbi:TPA: IS4 family transposase, partial [Legionella pneumophila]|nr:IS4 family transposase [Legionella pneumophila]
MDLAIEDSAAWSEAIYGSVALGDKRLTRRLIQIGKQLSSISGGSLPAS